MHMHIPKPRDHVLAAGVQNSGSGGQLHCRARCDLDDAFATHHNRHVPLSPTGRRINNGRMAEGNARCLRLGQAKSCRQNQKESTHVRNWTPINEDRFLWTAMWHKLPPKSHIIQSASAVAALSPVPIDFAVGWGP